MLGKKFKLLFIIALCCFMASCDEPSVPVTTTMVLYSPNDSVKVSYYNSLIDGDIEEECVVIQPCEYCQYVGGIVGNTPGILEKHPEYKEYRVTKYNSGSKLIIFPFRSIYINGEIVVLPQSEQELQRFQYPMAKVMELLSQQQGNSIVIEDDDTHVLPISFTWNSQQKGVRVDYGQGQLPEVKIN